MSVPTSSIAGLLALMLLQACSEKTVTAPAAPVKPVAVAAAPAAPVAPVAKAETAVEAPDTAPASFERSANLQCADRKISLKATCVNIWGARTLACTSQRFSVSDTLENRELNARVYAPGKPEGTDPGIVDGSFSEISCVTTKSNEKYIVAYMARPGGGNCEQCEWVDVYSWDGILLGTEGGGNGKSSSKAVAEASAAAFDPKLPAMAKISLDDFYDDPTGQ